MDSGRFAVMTGKAYRERAGEGGSPWITGLHGWILTWSCRHEDRRNQGGEGVSKSDLP